MNLSVHDRLQVTIDWLTSLPSKCYIILPHSRCNLLSPLITDQISLHSLSLLRRRAMIKISRISMVLSYGDLSDIADSFGYIKWLVVEYKIVQGGHSDWNTGLDVEIVFRGQKQYPESTFEHTKKPLDLVSQLCVTQVEQFFFSYWPMNLFYCLV